MSRMPCTSRANATARDRGESCAEVSKREDPGTLSVPVASGVIARASHLQEMQLRRPARLPSFAVDGSLPKRRGIHRRCPAGIHVRLQRIRQRGALPSSHPGRMTRRRFHSASLPGAERPWGSDAGEPGRVCSVSPTVGLTAERDAYHLTRKYSAAWNYACGRSACGRTPSRILPSGGEVRVSIRMVVTTRYEACRSTYLIRVCTVHDRWMTLHPTRRLSARVHVGARTVPDRAERPRPVRAPECREMSRGGSVHTGWRPGGSWAKRGDLARDKTPQVCNAMARRPDRREPTLDSSRSSARSATCLAM